MTSLPRLRPALNGVFAYRGRGGKRWWGCDYRDARTGKRRRKVKMRTQAEALSFRDDKAKEWEGIQEPAAEAPLAFDKLVERFLEEYQPRSGRLDYYEQRSDVWLEHFSGSVARITTTDVDRFRAARAAKVSATTVRQDLTSLSTLFRWAMARQLVRWNPAAPEQVRRPSKPRPNPRPLDAAEIARLLAAAPPWLAPVVTVALETGADRGELAGLAWGVHVDEARRVIHLPRAKTGVGRAMPYRLNRAVRRVLDAAGRRRHASGLVFLRDGEPIAFEALKTAMRRAWAAAGIAKPKPWKSLRATFATRKAEAGVPVPTIAALMGLTTAYVLEHYIQPSGLHLEQAMASRRTRGSGGA